jgi:hypothetical protein
VNGGRWIAASTPPGARVLVAPDEPEFYYLSGRMAVTSYVYLLPINISDALVAQVTDDVLASDVPAEHHRVRARRGGRSTPTAGATARRAFGRGILPSWLCATAASQQVKLCLAAIEVWLCGMV